MARKKLHIRNPQMRSASLCGRKSVDFPASNREADCTTCLRLAIDGTLDRLELEANPKQVGANNSGIPRYTDQQRKFAGSHIVTTNPRQAALDAGYSKSYAKAHAHALREQLSPLIIQTQEAAKRINAISVAKVQTELASMGFANVLDYFDISEDGAMMPKKINDLTREQAAAIQEVKIIDVEREDPDTGEMITEYRIGWLKLADKRANLVELGKTLGMFNKIELPDKREAALLMSDVPTSALQDAEALLLAAVAEAKDQRRNREAIPGEYKELPAPKGEDK